MRYLAIFLLMDYLFALNLTKEKIWKIDSRKKSIYFNRGVFHSGVQGVPSRLIGIRHSYNRDKGHERIVFDFNTPEAPRLYGHLSDSEQKLYVDFFQSTMKESLKFPDGGQYMKSVNFLPDVEMLSAELKFNASVQAEIFYLSSPGRFVVDLKGKPPRVNP